MTAPELRAVDRERTLVMVPIAACEQHGPHLPTGTDTIICGAVAEGVEQRCGDSLLLLPTLWLGASGHHLPWGATLSASIEAYTSLLCEIVEPLLDDGYRRVMLLNGRGGNIDPMRVALRSLQPDYQNVLLTAASYWAIAEQQIAEIMEGPIKHVGHACEAETSLVMHLRGELVREDEVTDNSDYLPDIVDGVYLCRDMAQRTERGAAGCSHLGTAEKGAALYESIVSRVTAAVGRLLEEPLPEPVEKRG